MRFILSEYASTRHPRVLERQMSYFRLPVPTVLQKDVKQGYIEHLYSNLMSYYVGTPCSHVKLRNLFNITKSTEIKTITKMFSVVLLWCASADKFISEERTEPDQLGPLCAGSRV